MGKNLLNKGRERTDDKIHTCNIRVWTEVKGTIVILGWVGTVGRNILLNFHGEIEVVDHILRDCTAACLEGGGVGPIVDTRELETFDVGRVDYGVVAATVSHIARGEGSFIASSGARDINQKTAERPGRLDGSWRGRFVINVKLVAKKRLSSHLCEVRYFSLSSLKPLG